MIIKICDHTFPFAAKTREVTPMHDAINVRRSKSPGKIFAITITTNEQIHTHHSLLVKLAIGSLISVLKLLSYYKTRKKKTKIPIFYDLTIETLTLNFPTRWQESAVIYFIAISYNIPEKTCPPLFVFSLIMKQQEITFPS